MVREEEEIGSGKLKRGEEVGGEGKREEGSLTEMFILSKNSRTSSTVHSNERFPRKTMYGGFVSRRLGSTLRAEANE